MNKVGFTLALVLLTFTSFGLVLGQEHSPAAEPVAKPKAARPRSTTATAPHRNAAKSGHAAASSSHARHSATKAGSATNKKPASKASSKAARAEKARRVHRLNRAFVASADLKPMARQLFADHSRAAYAGVEAYARRHAGTDAGSLGWLAVGYARLSDKDYPKAIESLKLAQAHAGDLGDYAAYFLASAYSGQGRSVDAATTLREFEAKYPDSLFLRDAMHTYGASLVTSGRPGEAVRVLEKYRQPARADYELEIGRAFEAMGDYAHAAEAYQRVYYAMPLAFEAAPAQAALDHLVANGSVPPASFADRKARADLLALAHHSADAAHEYRALLAEAPAGEHDSLTIALGVALHHNGNDRESRSLLESVPDAADQSNGQRLFALAEMARSAEDDGQFENVLSRLRQTAPTSEYLEQALMLGGNMFLLHQEYDRAIDHYRELQVRFPTAKRASYAHWKAAWLALRQGRADEAKREFEQEVQLYPTGPEASAALYWRARLAEEDHDYGKARAWYETLTRRFSNYYYSGLARTRLAGLSSAPAVSDPILEKIPPPVVPDGFAVLDPPDDNVRLEKSRLLLNAGMTDFAVKELRAASEGAAWAPIEIARIYQDSGRYDRALQILKRALPGYFALDVQQLPRPYWENLFPRPYWTDLKRSAQQNDLDPFLVASLIRQESEFNPGAVSHADALGLMQLLPNTGRKVAREMRIPRYSSNGLLSPGLNMQLGTRYFRTMVDHFGGHVEYALAAYNAGADRVQSWLAQGSYRDTDEFVESIPFTETREYVQAIMRNAAIYRKLYGSP